MKFRAAQVPFVSGPFFTPPSRRTPNAHPRLPANRISCRPCSRAVESDATPHCGGPPDAHKSRCPRFRAVTRTNGGQFGTDLPIRNTAGSLLNIESNLLISGRSPNKTDNYSVDQLAGNTTFSNGATLTCRGFFMGDGYLVTNGTDEAKIAPDMGYNDSLVRVEGGID